MGIDAKMEIRFRSTKRHESRKEQEIRSETRTMDDALRSERLHQRDKLIVKIAAQSKCRPPSMVSCDQSAEYLRGKAGNKNRKEIRTV